MDFSKNSKKGFTIIELIVIIAIIGILVLLAAPKFLGHIQKTHLTRIQTDVKITESIVDSKRVLDDNIINNWEKLSQEEIEASRDENKLYDVRGLIVSDYEFIEEYFEVPSELISSKLKGSFYVSQGGKAYYEDTKSNKIRDKEDEQNEEDEVEHEYFDGFLFDTETNTIIGWDDDYGQIPENLVIPGILVRDNVSYDVLKIGAKAFYDRGLEKLEIKDGIQEISNQAFYLNEIKELNLGKDVKTITSRWDILDVESKVKIIPKVTLSTLGRDRAFSGGSGSGTTPLAFDVKEIETLRVSSDNQYYSTYDNALYNKDANILLVATKGTSQIQSNTEYIYHMAFSNLNKRIMLPQSIVGIDSQAFDGNDILEVDLPSVRYIGDRAFIENPNLGSIKLGEHIEYIGRNIAYSNENLRMDIDLNFNEVDYLSIMHLQNYIPLPSEKVYFKDGKLTDLRQSGLECFPVSENECFIIGYVGNSPVSSEGVIIIPNTFNYANKTFRVAGININSFIRVQASVREITLPSELIIDKDLGLSNLKEAYESTGQAGGTYIKNNDGLWSKQ